MNKIKIVKKGYTLTVTSWENDGDNVKTKTKTVKTKEEAQKINKICNELFISCNNGEGGIGNSMNDESDWVIEQFIEDNPEMNLTIEYIDNLAYELMGSSDFYDYRVCESCTITYIDKDIYAEQIKF